MKVFRPIRCLLVLLLLAQGMMGMAQHYVPIQGVVDTLLVLPKLGDDSAYLVNESLTVVEGGDLRIAPGTKMYFAQSAALRVDGGRLFLDGQQRDSIYLMCYEFSQDWAGVQVKNVSLEDSIRFHYVEFVGALTALTTTNCEQVSVSHCSFKNYYAGKGIEIIDCTDCSVDSCFFSQCISGVELKARATHSTGNLITHNIFDQGQINIEISNVGYGFKCNNNHVSDNYFEGAATAISFETVGGISDQVAVNFIENNLISSNVPGSGGYSSYGIKAAMDSLVIRNNVFWRNDEAVRMMRVCRLYLKNNTFYDNGLVLSNLLPAGTAVFEGNTISEAQNKVISFPSGRSRMNGNNILHFKKDDILFANLSAEDIDMRGNYWDVDSVAEIESVILDKHDTPTLGEIIYEGYLTECDTTAPVSPPFEVKKQFVNNRWRVSWEENPESDVDHYMLFYGNFSYYKFSHHTGAIYANSCMLTPQQAGNNVAVVACDRDFDPSVYASLGQSAYAFASYYPYAGPDASLCAPTPSYTLDSANIPYTYSGFVWRTSGTGHFTDSLSLRPSYRPSEADYEAGEVTLTLRVVSNGMVKTDAMKLVLHKELSVFAGEDYYSGMDLPILLDRAEAYNYDSLRWHSLGDGRFGDIHTLHTLYYLGEQDREQGYVDLVLEAWSVCGHVSSRVHYDLLKVFALEGKTWLKGAEFPNAQVIAASLSDENQFMSGFYRTVSDVEGAFRFVALLPDTYILYAFPDTVDVESAGCYYLGEWQWGESNMIEVDGDVYDVDIELPVRESGFSLGEGRIAGVFELPVQSFKPRDFYCQSWLREGDADTYCTEGLSNVGILLLNANKQRVLGFALTDHEGKFNFRNLPFGTYYVMADLPRYGRGMCEEITLSPDQPSALDLHLYVEEGKVKMRPQSLQEVEREVSIYPNPAEEEITLGGLEEQAEYVVSVMNSLGATLLRERKMHTDLSGECVIAVADLPVGVYFVRLSNSTETLMVKFVKR